MPNSNFYLYHGRRLKDRVCLASSAAISRDSVEEKTFFSAMQFLSVIDLTCLASATLSSRIAFLYYDSLQINPISAHLQKRLVAYKYAFQGSQVFAKSTESRMRTARSPVGAQALLQELRRISRISLIRHRYRRRLQCQDWPPFNAFLADRFVRLLLTTHMP